MIYNVETAQIQIELVEGLKLGNECLKKMHDVLSIETVEKIMDETRELVEYQKEIDVLVSGQLHEEDLYEIEREYEELVKDVSNVPDLPEVPNEAPPKPAKEKATKREKVALEA
uniref:Charged multivesicular body protein 6 n=1 Tax=Romanomermis culicivorax TaxID=13658 RepID=A0A915L5A5_ROMCU